MASIRIAFATAIAVAALLAGSAVHHASATHAVHVVAKAVVTSNDPVGCCED